MITGEPVPVAKKAGDRVTGATINGNGTLVDARRARRLRDAARADRAHGGAGAAHTAPVQRLADVVAAYFVPAVIAIAVVTALAWGFFGPGAATRLRAGQRGRGADHRLPLRGGPRDADLDHGGDGPGRARTACCSAMPRRWRSCARSTRWSWTRPARSRWASPQLVDCRRAKASTRRSCCASSRASSARSEHPLAQAIVEGRARRGASRSRRSRTSDSLTGQGVARPSTAGASRRQPQLHGRAGIVPAWQTARSAACAKARP